jgi:hypothetical protein
MATNIVQSDQPSIYDTLSTLRTANPDQYAAIVRPDKPPSGIGGFVFDIPGDEEVRMKANISRHYVESNVPIADHIALEPEQITLRGMVAEIAVVQKTVVPTSRAVGVLPLCCPMMPRLTAGVVSKLAGLAVGNVMGKLPGVAGMGAATAAAILNGGTVPGAAMVATGQAALAQAAANVSGLPAGTTSALLGMASSGIASNLASALSSLTGSSGSSGMRTAGLMLAEAAQAAAGEGAQSVFSYYQSQYVFSSRQTTAFTYFQQLWFGRQTCSVETPWGIYTNMAIAEVRAVQPKESKGYSDFTVVFEKIRVAGDITVQVGPLQGRDVIGEPSVTTSIGSSTASYPVLNKTLSGLNGLNPNLGP